MFSDYASVLGARFGSVLLSLGSVAITTRILAPAGYGTVSYLAVIATLIFTITSAWTSAAVSRYGREELEQTGTMVAVTWNRIILTTPLLVLAVFAVVGLKLSGALPKDFGWTYVALALTSGFLLVTSDHVVYLLEAGGRIKVSAAGLLLRQLLVVASLAAILATGAGRSAVVVVALSLCSSLALTVVFGAIAWRLGIWPPTLDRSLMRRMLVFSAPLIAFTVSQYVIRFVDLVVIHANGTIADVGVYAVSYQGYTVFQGLAAASGPVLTPLFVSLQMADKESQVRRYVERVVPQMLFVSAILAGLAAPAVVPLVPIVFGHGFGGAAVPLVILLVAQVLFFASSLTAPVLLLYERTGAAALINVVAAMVNVLADVIFIGVLRIGIAGAAIATTLALAVILAGYLVTSHRASGARVTVNPLLLTPLAVGIAFALALSGPLGVVEGIVAVCVAATVTVVTLRPFKVGDAAFVARLDLPPRLKSLVFRGIEAISR